MKIKEFLFFIILIISYLNAKDLNPSFSYNTSASVTELMFNNHKLYASTIASSIDIFDIKTKEKISSIKIPKIKDFLGDEIESKIYSFDILEDKILILSQGNKGGRNIDIFENNKFKNIISDKKRMFIAKAKFLDKNNIVFALLSNEVYFYDMQKKEVKKIIQISHSSFSDFVLTEDKKYIIIADESGILTMLNTKTFELIKKFEKVNLDKVFQVDSKNNYILTAGQDRLSAFYNIKNKKAYTKKAPFLIYSAGLSPKAKFAGIALNEENDVLIFNTKSKMNLFLLKKNPSLITDILFINEEEIFISSEHNKINYYNLKGKK